MNYSNIGVITSYSRYYLDEMTTLPNTFIALFIVFFATRINIGSLGVINKISACMGAVYISHQIQAFYPTLWKVICSLCNNYLGGFSIFVVLFVVFILFVVIVMLFEYVRLMIWNTIAGTNVFKRFRQASVFNVYR